MAAVVLIFPFMNLKILIQLALTFLFSVAARVAVNLYLQATETGVEISTHGWAKSAVLK